MEELELYITDSGMDGEGVARKDGKVYFVEGAVKGDRVIAIKVKENKNFVRCKIIKINEKSSLRTLPPCEYYDFCGGCNMQHMKYELQLEIKRQNIKSLFDKSKLSVEINKVISGKNNYYYRNKLTMYLTPNGSLGFYEKNSHNLIEINKCMLVDEKFNNFINIFNKFIKNNRVFNHFLIKGVMIRKIEDTFIINLILTKKINLTKLENLLKLNKIKYSIYFCISQNNLPKKPVFFVGGASEVVTNEFGINYPVYPMSFIQVNEEVKNIVYKKILSLINENDIVVDAYSGAGLLSAIISQKVKKVFAIEIEEQATNACKKLIDLNSIKNLFAINGDCAIEVPSILQREKIDVIIMDPARKGVDDSTLESIVLAKPKKIIYLSCNPSTLVRDLKIICEKENYKINFVQPYDMFPQTSEVETLVELILE